MANNNGQTCLEKRGIEERHNEIVRSDYNIEDEYSAKHKDAISDGDALGKGTNHGGHGHFLPDCNMNTTTYNYSNFDTTNGGDAMILKVETVLAVGIELCQYQSTTRRIHTVLLL